MLSIVIINGKRLPLVCVFLLIPAYRTAVTLLPSITGLSVLKLRYRAVCLLKINALIAWEIQLEQKHNSKNLKAN